MLEQWEFYKLLPISQSAGKCFKNARLKRPSLSTPALPSLFVYRPSWNLKLYKKNWFCGFYVNCCHMSTARSSVRPKALYIFLGYIVAFLLFLFSSHVVVCVLFRRRPHIPLRSPSDSKYRLSKILLLFCFFRSVYEYSMPHSCFSGWFFFHRRFV